ncbi:hypothetical protein [Asticcacaulis sp. AC402]|uniref:hypothetical protein n=1 Tax=Asticcacaulis sp. AC402 TaxID=1282361 RepID=UPI0003C3D9E0|nr:hypothetical protein [Asticcacaulis sp. AC402]ESQ76792.1 hypothetical protein ABAC402_03790 [Asticcacaulis sp. AC402]
MVTTIDLAVIAETLASASPWEVFLDMTLVAKVSTMMVVIAGIASVIIAVTLKGRTKAKSLLLTVMGYGALGWAVYGGLYEATNTYIGAQKTQTTSWITLLPSFVEIAYLLLMGMIVWIITAMGHDRAPKTRKGPERAPGLYN